MWRANRLRVAGNDNEATQAVVSRRRQHWPRRLGKLPRRSCHRYARGVYPHQIEDNVFAPTIFGADVGGSVVPNPVAYSPALQYRMPPRGLLHLQCQAQRALLGVRPVGQCVDRTGVRGWCKQCSHKHARAPCVPRHCALVAVGAFDWALTKPQLEAS